MLFSHYVAFNTNNYESDMPLNGIRKQRKSLLNLLFDLWVTTKLVISNGLYNHIAPITHSPLFFFFSHRASYSFVRTTKSKPTLKVKLNNQSDHWRTTISFDWKFSDIKNSRSQLENQDMSVSFWSYIALKVFIELNPKLIEFNHPTLEFWTNWHFGTQISSWRNWE